MVATTEKIIQPNTRLHLYRSLFKANSFMVVANRPVNHLETEIVQIK